MDDVGGGEKKRADNFKFWNYISMMYEWMNEWNEIDKLHYIILCGNLPSTILYDKLSG